MTVVSLGLEISPFARLVSEPPVGFSARHSHGVISFSKLLIAMNSKTANGKRDLPSVAFYLASNWEVDINRPAST
jgi:hypothetical protein